MKKFKSFYKILLLSSVYFLSCTDLTDVAEDAIVTNGPVDAGAGSPEAVLGDAYAQLNGFNAENNLFGLLEGSSDELVVPTRGTDWSDFGVWRQMQQHTWDPTHSFIFNAWQQLNTGTFRAERAIQVAGSNVAILAPARFLRAFYTYYLVDLYGQVPYRTDLNDPDEVPSVYTRVEATDLIIEDLNYAIENLPSFDPNNHGVASKEAAQFLLAKVYLNKPVFTAENPAGPYNFAVEDMQKVVSLADAVIASGSFSLTDYWDNFGPNNGAESKEIVLGRINNPGAPISNVTNRIYNTLHYSQGGWNGFSTLADFYNKWNEPSVGGDVRKNSAVPGITDQNGIRGGFLEGQQYDKDGNELKDRSGNPLVFTVELDLLYSNERNGVRVIKYLPPPNDPDTDFDESQAPGNDFILLRYADLLLMRAEALFRLGDESALSQVNEIRTQRGANALTSLSEQALLDERGYEMYWEGWRRNDQIRFGVFLGEWTEKPASPPTSVLYPIPQRAIDTNPNLIQNEGY
ncbi:MAG TPA: RagB/SusD family nutrient uptake outer membrane protein [Cytophagales bacterium]|nr:RagB/SusD family nutrient uptake outer membrane protein [Cytophagales bacterium]